MEKKPARAWDLTASLIMLFAVFLSAWRLGASDWADGLGQIYNTAAIGYFIGLALGYSRYQKRGIILLSLAYTATVIPWQLLGTIEFGESQSWLLDRLGVLLGRLLTDLGELFAGRPVKDQFFAVTLMCLPYWFASLYGGYNLTRRADFLRTILPNGVLMLVIHAYHYTAKDYSWMFGAYLFLAFILLSRLKYIANRGKWADERVQVSSESRLDMTISTAAAAAILIMLSWSIPYILPATAEGREFWRNTYGELFPPDRFEDVFASLDKEGRPTPRNFQTELSLGSRTPKSDAVIFRVFTPTDAADLPRLYWRGQVYDRYEDGKWRVTGDNESPRKPASGDILIPDSAHRQRLGFTFDVLAKSQSVVYMPAQPVWVNHDAILLFSSGVEEETNLAEDNTEIVFDVIAIRAFPAFKAGDLYRAGALIGNPTVVELREAEKNYPDWVAGKYLQLPGDFSPRIRGLANQIAAPYDNPYDKANAITAYLRDKIEYSGSVAPPGAGVDPLEYFLFESKTGFCNYYATAEVLMLRSIGIPARLAVGYAQGESNQQRSIYVVRERDLHAWPEVYFPEYGWVEFEPTGNQDQLERPLDRDGSESDADAPMDPLDELRLEKERGPQPPTDLAEEEEKETASAWTRRNGLASALAWLGGVFILLLALALGKRFAPRATAASALKRVIERAGWSPPQWLSRWLVFINRSRIERHFHSVNVCLGWMKRPQPAHATAYERAQLLKRLLPGATESIETLLREHQSEMFTPRGGNETIARRAAWNILYKTAQRRLEIAILGYNYAEEQETPPHPL